jgi:hypothetical protein
MRMQQPQRLQQHQCVQLPLPRSQSLLLQQMKACFQAASQKKRRVRLVLQLILQQQHQ